MPTHRAFWFAAGAACALVASALLVPRLRPAGARDAPEAATPAPAPASDERLERLEALVDTLTTALDDAPEPRRAAPEPARREVVPQQPTSDLDERLERLELLVASLEKVSEQLGARLAVGPLPTQEQLLRAGMHRDEGTLKALRDALDAKQHHSAAVDELRFLSYDEILVRYGPPTSIRIGDDGLRWYYCWTREGARYWYDQQCVRFLFLEGYVTEVQTSGKP